MQSDDVHDNKPKRSVRKRRLWRWFAAGFLLVFAGMAFTVSMYAWTLKADAIIRCKLWEFYALEFERALNGNRAMGPASGSSWRAIETGLVHLVCSAAGGAIAAGIGWTYHQFRSGRGGAAHGEEACRPSG
jgi:hypothetical protein